MNYTDQQLKAALAKMLPDKVSIKHEGSLVWFQKSYKALVLDTELLHLCWIVESALNMNGQHAEDYVCSLNVLIHEEQDDGFEVWLPLIRASWQQRVIALCKVKGVEI